MVLGHQAIVGSLIPPSNVVCLPHKNGPLLPPGNKEYVSENQSIEQFIALVHLNSVTLLRLSLLAILKFVLKVVILLNLLIQDYQQNYKIKFQVIQSLFWPISRFSQG